MAPVALSLSNFSDNPETSGGLPPTPYLSSPSSVIKHSWPEESLKGDYNPSDKKGRENTFSTEQ